MRNSGRQRRTGNNRRPGGNSSNRVFESTGPDGKVRGNSLQIIEKYQAFSRDALLSGDQIISENFSQHAEHYIRLLGFQKEQEEKRALNNPRQNNGHAHGNRHMTAPSDSEAQANTNSEKRPVKNVESSEENVSA